MCRLLGLFVLPIMLSWSASASLIAFNGYTHDTNTDIVKGQGLEWLQWDRTVGISASDAQSLKDSIEGGGWRIADNTDISNLFNAFGLGGRNDWDSNPLTGQTATNLYNSTELLADPEFVFTLMFGTTRFGISTDPEPSQVSGVRFNQTFNLSSDTWLHNVADSVDDYSRNIGISVSDFDGYSRISSHIEEFTGVVENTGVAYVRAIIVSEPNSMLIFLVGLGLLWSVSCRRLMRIPIDGYAITSLLSKSKKY